MLDPYDVANVKPDMIINEEEMGSRKKFWYRAKHDLWLFKIPRENTGEHWAEKIAERAASVLEIVHAEVELARFEERRGTVTRSFARGGRTLHHGNQFLEKIVQGYDPDKKFHQSNHAVGNIFRVIDTIFLTSEGAKSAKTRMAGYIVLDALIGNTDHENWGILRKRVGDQWKCFVAPSSCLIFGAGAEGRTPQQVHGSRASRVVFGKGAWRDLLVRVRKTRSEPIGTCAASASTLS